MPLDETALAELGLAPQWVRRGTAVRADEASAAGSGAAASKAEPAGVLTARAGIEPAQAETAAIASVRQAVVEEDGGKAGNAQSIASAQVDRGAGAIPMESTPSPRRDSPTSNDPAADDDFAWPDEVLVPAGNLPSVEPMPVLEPTATGSDVATLDWNDLAERVASCTRCRLCERRTNTVFGVGDREAEWMLIGEAPGENEDRQGEPFVGQAGKLLDNMLRSLSLVRGDNVYIANVIKCRPPGNRNPEPDEVARCEPYLQRQVALVKPKIIVALGRFAAQSLLKTDASIASLRGRVHAYENVPVIITYHPAYLLRSLHDKSKAWADLCLARDTWRAAPGERG